MMPRGGKKVSRIVRMSIGLLLLMAFPAVAGSLVVSDGQVMTPDHPGLTAIHPSVSSAGWQGIEDLPDSRCPSPVAMTANNGERERTQSPSADVKPQKSAEIAADQNSAENEEELPGFEEEKPVADPLAPWNRAMFHFNDKLYHWVLKPAAKGYNAVLPEPVRTSVGNFFQNVTMPVRFVSSLLAGRVKAAGIELARFGINSTAGLGGLFDVARQYHLEKQQSDLGLTVGRYGIGEGIYIVWPFLGPSSLRDTAGTVGDAFLDPLSYITPQQDAIAVSGYDYFNYAALHINDYQDLVESAVEPYVALRNAYIQHRRSLISK